jgi:hypothetical protein
VADELIDAALADSFLAASAALAKALRQRGISLTTLEQDMVIVRQAGGWRTEFRDGSHNLLAGDFVAYAVPTLLPPREIARIRKCAAQVAAAASATLPFATMVAGHGSPLTEPVRTSLEVPPDFDTSPARWVSRAIVDRALLWHLARLPSLDAADQHSAAAFAEDVLRVARDDRLRYRIVVPLGGIEIDNASGGNLTEGAVRIRALSDVEQAQRFRESEPYRGPRFSGYEPPQVELEISASGPRDAEAWLGHVEGPRLIAALQLHGYYPGGTVASQYPDPE